MALFGGQQPAAQSTPSLFGAPQPTSASLFSTPQSSASLFGAPSQSSASLFGAPAQSSASLFGAPAQSSAALFGAPAQSAPSLFGAPTQSSASLFGAPPSSASLFGAPATAPSLFAAIGASQPSTLWGQSQPQQGLPNQQPEPPKEITGRTPISQLPQNFQTDLFAVERHLREQRNKSSKLWSKRSHVDNEIAQVKTQATGVTRRLVKLRAALESLRANADTLKAAVRTERASAEPVVIALDNYKAGHASSQVGFLGGGNSFRYASLEGNVSDRMTRVPDEYFMRIVDELESRAHEYKGEVDEIANYLRAQGVVLSRKKGPDGGQNAKKTGLYMGMADGGTQRHMDMDGAASNEAMASKGKTIEDVIRRQYEYFMVVASHVAGVHENLRTAREQFLQLLRARDADAMDPFQQADLREKADKERLRLIAEKRASEGTAAFNGTSTLKTQGSQLQNQSTGFGSASSGFGGTFAGVQAAGSGSGNGASFGTSDATGSGQGRRMSSGRRRRS